MNPPNEDQEQDTATNPNLTVETEEATETPAPPPKLSPWQRKLQTFYNPEPGREVSEVAFILAL